MRKRPRSKNRFRTAGANALADVSFQAAETATSSPQGGPASALDTLDPKLEYVGGYGIANSTLERTLPSQLRDPRAPEVTFETYRQMLNDPEVCSDVRTLRDMALADGIQISPGIDRNLADDDAPEFARAVEMAEFVERNLVGLRKPLEDTLEGIVESALTYGHKTAEITWKLATGQDAGKLMLDRIAQKDYRTLDFVVDRFWNHLGFTARTPAQSVTTMTVIPREKFFHLALHEEDEDPRGRSSIRSVYTAWTFKCLTWPEYFRWLQNCALPSVIGVTAPKQPGDVQRNADGSKTAGGKALSPAEAMLQALLGLKSASVAIVPNGAQIEQLEVMGEGAGFERGINVADSQISKAILFQTLATSEAQFGTRAQSETHMGVLDMVVWWLKGRIAKALKSDLVEKIIRYNFGDEALRFTPQISLGDTERRDWATDAAAAVQLSSEITDSQWNAVTEQIGLPPPLPGEEPRGMARQAQIAEQSGKPVQTPVPPDNKRQAALRRFKPRAGAFVTVKMRRAA
jgi:hypothetical protein